MAKRFTASDKWRDKWFRKLKAPFKLLWIYLLDECNHAGIWEVDIELANFVIGIDINEKQAIEIFDGRIIPIKNNEKWFIPKFIDFQYGTLNSENRAHLSVINLLKKEGAYKLLKRGLEGRKDMDKDKDMVKDKVKEIDKDKEKISFAEFVSMTQEEHDKLTVKYGIEATKAMIEKLDNYKGSNGKTYKSDYRAILNWVVEEMFKEKKINEPQWSKTFREANLINQEKMKNAKKE